MLVRMNADVVLSVSNTDQFQEDWIMKKTSLLSMLILALALSTLAACGGGGGGGGVTIPQPTTAVLTLSTAVTGSNPIPSNTIITGYDVTISLPAGVTVKSTNPPQTDAGVVTDYPAGSYMDAVYSAATGTTIPGKVRILITSGTGYYAGVFSKVNCNIAAGQYPKASDFQQPTFAASGWDDNTKSTVDLTGYLSLTATAVIQ
jgi:hypothetical protein